jgi:hypothetical protein
MAISSLADVAEYLSRTGREVRTSPNGELAQCNYDHHGTPVVVTLRQLTFATGSLWLGLSIPICPFERIRPRTALVANGELPIGVLALWEQQILLRQTLPLTGLTAEPLEQTLGALADTAGQLVLIAARMAADPSQETPYGYLFR